MISSPEPPISFVLNNKWIFLFDEAVLFHCMSKAFSLGIWNNPCIVVQIFMMNKNRCIKLTGYLLLHKLLPRCVLVCRTKRAPLECSSQCTAPTRKRETIESWMVNSGERRKEIKRAKNRRRTVFMAEIQGEEWKCGKDYSLPLTVQCQLVILAYSILISFLCLPSFNRGDYHASSKRKVWEKENERSERWLYGNEIAN